MLSSIGGLSAPEAARSVPDRGRRPRRAGLSRRRGGGDFSTYSGELPLANGLLLVGCGACSWDKARRSRSDIGARSGGLLGVSSTRGCMNTKRV